LEQIWEDLPQEHINLSVAYATLLILLEH